MGFQKPGPQHFNHYGIVVTAKLDTAAAGYQIYLLEV